MFAKQAKQLGVAPPKGKGGMVDGDGVPDPAGRQSGHVTDSELEDMLRLTVSCLHGELLRGNSVTFSWVAFPRCFQETRRLTLPSPDYAGGACPGRVLFV